MRRGEAIRQVEFIFGVTLALALLCRLVLENPARSCPELRALVMYANAMAD